MVADSTDGTLQLKNFALPDRRDRTERTQRTTSMEQPTESEQHELEETTHSEQNEQEETTHTHNEQYEEYEQNEHSEITEEEPTEREESEQGEESEMTDEQKTLEMRGFDFIERVLELKFEVPDSEWKEFYGAFLDNTLEAFPESEELSKRLWKLLPFARDALTKFVRDEIEESAANGKALTYFKGNMAYDISILSLWNEKGDDDLSYKYRSLVTMILQDEKPYMEYWIKMNIVSFLRDGLEYWTGLMKIDKDENFLAGLAVLRDVIERFDKAARGLFEDAENGTLHRYAFVFYMRDLSLAIEGRKHSKVSTKKANILEFFCIIEEAIRLGGKDRVTLNLVLKEMHKVMEPISHKEWVEEVDNDEKVVDEQNEKVVTQDENEQVIIEQENEDEVAGVEEVENEQVVVEEEVEEDTDTEEEEEADITEYSQRDDEDDEE